MTTDGLQLQLNGFLNGFFSDFWNFGRKMVVFGQVRNFNLDEWGAI